MQLYKNIIANEITDVNAMIQYRFSIKYFKAGKRYLK